MGLVIPAAFFTGNLVRKPLTNLRTILTGASSGIGRAVALELARNQGQLVLVARREERLAEVQRQVMSLGGRAALVVGDVTEPDTRQRALEAAQREFGGLDCLINNAGVGAIGPATEPDIAVLRRIMEVNFFAAVEFTSLVLPALRSSGRGVVVQVGSILGHRALPRYGAYCASKFALRGFTETLRTELAAAGINVLLVSPGSTESEFLDNLLARDREGAFRAPRVTPAQVVARQTVQAIARGRREIIPSWSGRALVWLNRLAPAMLDRMLNIREG